MISLALRNYQFRNMRSSKYYIISFALMLFIAVICPAKAEAKSGLANPIKIETKDYTSDSTLKTREEYKNFLIKNLNVKALEWFTKTNVNVFLKTGEFETYNLLDEEENQTAYTKYGTFPRLPLLTQPKYLNEKPANVSGFQTNYKILGIHPSILVLVDGVETNHKIAEQLEKDKLASVVVLKGKEATNQYGERAKNGAIVILTKKYKE
ncbi:MAG: hypothetical protein ABI390_10030 [Daejeonella sp.]